MPRIKKPASSATGLWPRILLGLFLGLATLVAPGTIRAHGRNLIPEGSDFEAGWDGWSVDPLILLPNWKTYVPPSIDCTTAAHGRCSLKLVNGSGDDVFRVSSQGIRIPHTGGPITLSLYAKTDTPGCTLEYTLNNGFRAICSGSATLRRHWRRFHVTVTPARWYYPSNAGIRDVFYVQIIVPSTKPWRTIWLDAIQLEHGPLTAYHNPASVDLAFTTNKHIKVYYPNQIPRIILHAAGRDVTAQPVLVQREELFSHHQFPVMKLRLRRGVDADHGAVRIPLKPEPRGLYRLTARMANDRGFQQVVYGVIKPLGSRPHADAAFFGGSIGCILSATAQPWGFRLARRNSLMSFGYPPRQIFRFVHELGWGWWHAYLEFAFQTIQPVSSSQFRWRDSDTLTALAEKCHLDIYANLAGAGWPTAQPRWAWSKIPVEGGETNLAKGEKLVSAAKFGAFATAMGEHYKGRIFLWEPWNEPGVKMSPRLYAPLQQQVYTNLKQVDPRNQIYGLCATTVRWLKGCLRLGLGRYMDGIAIHCGSAKRNWLARVRHIAKAMTGRIYPIIDSEASGSNGADYPNLIPALAEGTRNPAPMTPQQLVRHIAYERVFGVARQSWFNVTSAQLGIFAHSLDLLEYDGAPTMPLIAYNTFIDYVGPMTSRAVVPVGGNIVCYVFGRGRRSVAVLWAAGQPRRVTIPLGAGRVVLDNMAGQRLPPKSSSPHAITLELHGQVVYLRAAHLNAARLRHALARIHIAGLSQVLIERAAIGRSRSGRPELVAILKGDTTHPQPGVLDILGSPQAWRLGASLAVYPAIPLDHTARVVFPILAGLGEGAEGAIRLGAAGGASVAWRSFNLKVWPAPRASVVPRWRGQLVGWKRLPFHRLSNWAKAAIVWNRSGLYIAAQVRDNTPRGFNPASGQADWQCDSLELYFNPTVNNQFTQRRYGPADFQVICSVRGGPGTRDWVHVAWRGRAASGPGFGNPWVRPDSIRLDSVRTARGYRARILVPWKNFPPAFQPRAGNFLGFSLSVRDVARNYRQLRRVIWAGGNNDYRFTTGLGILVLQ